MSEDDFLPSDVLREFGWVPSFDGTIGGPYDIIGALLGPDLHSAVMERCLELGHESMAESRAYACGRAWSYLGEDALRKLENSVVPSHISFANSDDAWQLTWNLVRWNGLPNQTQENVVTALKYIGF